MISEEKILKDLKKLVGLFMGQYKKASLEEQYSMSRVCPLLKKVSLGRVVPRIGHRPLKTQEMSSILN